MANLNKTSDDILTGQHSSRLHLFKLLLLVLVIILVFVFLWASFSSMCRSPVLLVAETVEMENEKKALMTALKVKGYTANRNESYALTAAKATQNLQHSNIINIQDIHAVFFLGGRGEMTIVARMGLFNKKNSFLKLPSPFTVQASDGMKAYFSSADLHIKTRYLSTEHKVEIFWDNEFLTANEMKIFDNGQRIIFKGNVEFVMNRTPRITQFSDQFFF